MADDIITQAFARPCCDVLSCGCADARMVIDHLQAEVDNAYGEIERLRTELAEAYDACRYALADSPRWQENCATVVASWEARRG